MTADTEQRLARIWADALVLDVVARDDNFFQLGGHSLLAAEVIVNTCAEFSVALPARAIFTAPTVAELARLVEAELASPSEQSVIPRAVRRPLPDPAP